MKMYKYQYHGRCAIMTLTYDRTIGGLDKLITEAIKDFPSLEREKIQFIIYGGDSVAGTTGIEFVTKTAIPGEYTFLPYGLEVRY